MAPSELTGFRVLITGATAGIGRATTEAFARAGVRGIVTVGRREDRLKDDAKRLADAHDVEITPVVLDVRDRDAIDAVASELFDVDVLVNNAGLARGMDPIHEADPADWAEMVETNVLGLLYMTRKVVPAMVERGSGHIVNLGSTAGRWVYPGGGVYNATKFAVRALTEGLRMDLHGSGIRVSNVAPGLVETEFSLVRHKGDAEKAAQVYADADVLTPADIAETIVWCCSRPSHVNVHELVIMPTDQSAVNKLYRRHAPS